MHQRYLLASQQKQALFIWAVRLAFRNLQPEFFGKVGRKSSRTGFRYDLE
jgi:hypothetical protein